MLGVCLGGRNPRHARQLAAGDVGGEDVEQPRRIALLGRAVRFDVGSGAGPLIQRAARSCVLVVEEVQQRVITEVADVVIRRKAPDAGGVQAVADVLIDLPADPRRLQPLRIGLPPVPELVVGYDRPAALPIIPVPPGPHVVTVGIGGAEHRAVVAIAHGERISQRVVEREIGAVQVRHARGGLGRQPPVPVTAIEHLVRLVPAVVEIHHERQR
jgi:hypothetical protein